LCKDATELFNAITGHSQELEYRKISAAPNGLRDKIYQLINNEIDRKRHGYKALIMIKMNSLVDSGIIKLLYKASQAGVDIHLNIRGICCLKPGIKGLSDTIKVNSIIDRYLEHARILYFYNGGDEKVFISSADWMPRNLNRRIELLIPIEDIPNRNSIKNILKIYLSDTVKSRLLLPDGTYTRNISPEKTKGLRAQEFFYSQACENLQFNKQKRCTNFIPHLPNEAGAK